MSSNWKGKKLPNSNKRHITQCTTITNNNNIPRKKRKILKKQKSKFRIESNINRRRSWTVSIALPGSILDTCSTPQLRTYLTSQIARCASIFTIDEIVIFSENGKMLIEKSFKSDPNLFLVRLLRLLETPQYLRRLLFGRHCDFRNVGICRPLRTAHHLTKDEISIFREGIVLNRKHKNRSLVNIGLEKECVITEKLDEDQRVTVEMFTEEESEMYYSGKVVSSSIPMTEHGLYWGYKVRFAQNISKVFTESTFDEGYDLVIGTSDKGRDIIQCGSFQLRSFLHLMIVFGGPSGLQACVIDNRGTKLKKPELLFDEYINVCPAQGTRTIRTEEAILITLSVLQQYIQGNYETI